MRGPTKFPGPTESHAVGLDLGKEGRKLWLVKVPTQVNAPSLPAYLPARESESLIPIEPGR